MCFLLDRSRLLNATKFASRQSEHSRELRSEARCPPLPLCSSDWHSVEAASSPLSVTAHQLQPAGDTPLPPGGHCSWLCGEECRGLGLVSGRCRLHTAGAALSLSLSHRARLYAGRLLAAAPWSFLTSPVCSVHVYKSALEL